MGPDVVYFPDVTAKTGSKEEASGALRDENEFNKLGIKLDLVESDEQLLIQVGGGSKAALAYLFRKYRRTVLSVASRILRDPSEAEDICQDVFVYLFQKAKHFDPGKGTASSWIIQITYHRAMNRRQFLALRQHEEVEKLSDEEIATGTDHSLVDELCARSLLYRLRKELNSDQQKTLELHFSEGYSLREIAEKTNQTLGNTRNHFYRGLERLRSLVFPQKGA
jgi:RNA polymerase sigma-70 factor, ECF subfamily